MIQLIISSLVTGLMVCVFLIFVAIPLFVVVSIGMLFFQWKKRFFPRGTRIYIDPKSNPMTDDSSAKAQDNVIDVEFHEVK